ncbi:hypothetical protein DFQ26_000328 [Actinomortierella ambigua]|nr:hypothetical protein DFQ26_000328 [Actinomortierella ambigua]
MPRAEEEVVAAAEEVVAAAEEAAAVEAAAVGHEVAPTTRHPEMTGRPLLEEEVIRTSLYTEEEVVALCLEILTSKKKSISRRLPGVSLRASLLAR